MNQEECQELYNEYNKLKSVMDDVFQAQQYVSGKLIVKTAPPIEDVERLQELKNILLSNCKDCLALRPDEWFEIGE